ASRETATRGPRTSCSTSTLSARASAASNTTSSAPRARCGTQASPKCSQGAWSSVSSSGRGQSRRRQHRNGLQHPGGGGGRSGNRRNLALLEDLDALTGECELDILAGLPDPPLDGCERDLERVGNLGVREPDDVAEQERHLQIDVEPLDRPPDGVDRLE